MKFIWNAPDLTKLKFDIQQAFVGWLRYNGVWFHDNKEHWEWSYNDLYHFYDITIYECWLPGNGAPDSVIQAMRKYLASSGLDWTESSSYRWEGEKQKPGVRFWIQAEDHPRSRRFNEKS